MGFQLGTIGFMIQELLPRVTCRERVVSLARLFIHTDPQHIKYCLDEAGFDTQRLNLSWEDGLSSRELFLLFGFEQYDDIDFNADEGCNIIHDLNLHLPKQYLGQYDLVVEMGTMEHIFDIRAVFDNITKLLKVGGSVFHFSPLDSINHGFYNFSLNLFYDVYRNNGFEDIELFIVAFPINWTENQKIIYDIIQFTPEEIFPNPPEGYHLMVSCIARKAEVVTPFKIPIQAAYDPTLRLQSSLKQFPPQDQE
jgi:SAM-dependent methyltransferase